MRFSAREICVITVTLFALTVSGCAYTQDRASNPSDALGYSAPAPESLDSTASNEIDAGFSSRQELIASSEGDYNIPEVADVSENQSPEPAPEEGNGAQDVMDEALLQYEASQRLWSDGNLEGAIEALDEAYDLIVKVDTSGAPELVQQKDDLRFMISKRILEVYASRYTAVNGNHDAIPLIMNEHVKAEIKKLTGPEKEFFIASYRRSGKYRGMMVEALREAGMPEELSWLPLIESGFKVRAYSRARALGLWQFIPSTGYKFGLSRDTWVDERLNPEKSTAAAIAYMEELHKIFGDWMTVLAAYNCGEGRVLKVIRKQSINYLDNFWDLYERLPRETARYVPRFLAVLHIIKDPDKYGMELGEPDLPALADTVEVNKQMRLLDIATKLGVGADELKELNPTLRRQVTPNGPFVLRVPHGTGFRLKAKLDEIPKWTPPKRQYVYHRVRWGESVSTIAAKYRTSVSAIVRTNNLRSRHRIRAGQRLKIPVSGSAKKVYAQKTPPGGKYHVQKGDSLWLIAKRYGTNTKTLQRINGLRSTTLHVGQILKVK
jgi:membrane-bound lytic murein transglycosylase D